MKKILLNYYQFRLQQLSTSISNLIQYRCLYSNYKTIIYYSLEFNYYLQKLVLEGYKSFLPKKWIRQ